MNKLWLVWLGNSVLEGKQTHEQELKITDILRIKISQSFFKVYIRLARVRLQNQSKNADEEKPNIPTKIYWFVVGIHQRKSLL